MAGIQGADSGIYGRLDTRLPLAAEQVRIPDVGAAMDAGQAYQRAELRKKQEQLSLAQTERDHAEDQDVAGLMKTYTQVGPNGELVVDRRGLMGEVTGRGYQRSAAKLGELFSQQDKDAADIAKKRNDLATSQQSKADAAVQQHVSGIMGLPEGQRAAAWERWTKELKAQGKLPANVPDAFDADYVNMTYNAAITPQQREEREARRKPGQWQSGQNGVMYRTLPDGSLETKQVAAPKQPEWRSAGDGRVFRTGPDGQPQFARAPAAPGTEVKPEDEGKISGVIRDKSGNRRIDPMVGKAFQESQGNIDTGVQLAGRVDTLIKDVLPKGPQSGAGELVGKVGAFTGTNVFGEGDKANAMKEMERFSVEALGALDSPLMKGAPSEGDARRALGVFNQPDASYEQKVKALQDFKAAVDGAVKWHNERLGMYDSETRQMLAGQGIRPREVAPTTKAPSTRPANKSGGKIFTKTEVREIAAAKGMSEAEVEQAIISKGGSIR